MPAQKKDPSVRRRRNKAATAATLSAASIVPVDERPELPEGVDWHPMTRTWWAELWAAPMAAEYHPSDRHALYILAALVDQFWQKPTKDLAGEIRLQRQAFGLTPYDRRRLEWTIEAAEESKDRGTQRRKRWQAEQSDVPAPGATPDPSADPRQVLRAVR